MSSSCYIRENTRGFDFAWSDCATASKDVPRTTGKNRRKSNTNAMMTLWIQNGLLLVNVLVVWKYVTETMKIRRASEQQTTRTQELVQAAQDQIESQSRPAVVASFTGGTIHLSNIGNGPAIYVELANVAQNVEPDFNRGADSATRIVSYIEADHGRDTRIDANWLANPAPSLQCRYKSLSGRTYVSLIDQRGGDALNTRFYER